jgi:hypothetical protein
MPILAKDLKYFDNSNNVPSPQSVQAPFNDEPADVWMGYDVATGQLCITNYNRTTIITCFAGSASQFSVAIVGALEEGGSSITLTATPSVGVVADYTFTWSNASSNEPTLDANPSYAVGPVNVNVVSNPSGALPARGLVKLRTVNILTGVAVESYYWVDLAIAA